MQIFDVPKELVFCRPLASPIFSWKIDFLMADFLMEIDFLMADFLMVDFLMESDFLMEIDFLNDGDFNQGRGETCGSNGHDLHNEESHFMNKWGPIGVQ